MSPDYKATLAPRIVIALAAAAIASPYVVKMSDSMEAMVRLGGGLVSLAGVAWFLILQRRIAAARKAGDTARHDPL